MATKRNHDYGLRGKNLVTLIPLVFNWGLTSFPFELHPLITRILETLEIFGNDTKKLNPGFSQLWKFLEIDAKN